MRLPALLLLLLLQPPTLGLDPVPEWAGLEAVAPQRTEDGSTMQSPLQADHRFPMWVRARPRLAPPRPSPSVA